MGSALVIGLFCAALVACIVAGLPMYAALAAGFVLFFSYGLAVRVPARELAKRALAGMRSVLNIIAAFMLIGVLTASWRAAGTIPAIVSACISAVHPSVFIAAAFLMVAAVGILLGSSFAISATMGSICMALGLALGCSPVLLGGAILGGAYVGDRFSPLSTSCLFTAQVTGVGHYDLLMRLPARGIGPVALAAIAYLALGIAFPVSGQATAELPYSQAFDLGPLTVLPALSVVVCAIARLDIKANMAISAAIAVVFAVFLQHVQPLELLRWLALGYEAPTAAIAATLDGGGIASMLNPTAIILISATYAGLFEASGLLEGLKRAIARMAQALTPSAALAVAAIPLSALTCNQTLSTLLAQQLFKEVYPDDGMELALDIEDSVIVMCALIPWCVAAAVPLATIGAPLACIPLAFYLYLQPLWMIAAALIRSKRA